MTELNDDSVLDDSELLQDRLLRSLHRNIDGHLSGSKKSHFESIDDTHNIATLYVYTFQDDSYMLHTHYVYTHEPLRYKEWLQLVIRECFAIEADKTDVYHGIYGWVTGFLRITPMRNGDLFIKVDADGATGVRLSFNPRTGKQDAHKEKKSKSR
jgi:hypothetical protein